MPDPAACCHIVPDLWGHLDGYTYGVSNAATPQPTIDLERYIRQARSIGRNVAFESGYASPEDAEHDAVVILLEYLARYPNAGWLKARERVRGRLWRLASPTIREERRRQRV